jgi:hypothetical protein
MQAAPPKPQALPLFPGRHWPWVQQPAQSAQGGHAANHTAHAVASGTAKLARGHAISRKSLSPHPHVVDTVVSTPRSPPN